MPKLDKKQAKEVEAATAAVGGYLLPEGRYAAQLNKVSEENGEQYPYWVWEFHNIHDEEGNRRAGRQWNNTSLSPKSVGFLKAVFEAFGYTSDSDTDEMLGEWVGLYLVQEPISKGPKTGQMRNSVQSLFEFNGDEWPFDPDEAAKAAVSSGSGGAADDSY